MKVIKRIIIFLSECEEIHYLPLIKLGQSLESEGLDVVYLTCFNGPCAGSSNVFNRLVDYSCITQRDNVRQALKDRNLGSIRLKEYIDDRLSKETSMVAETITVENYQSIEYHNFNIWDITKGSIARYLQRSYIAIPDDLAVIKRFYEAAFLYIEAFPRLYSSLQPVALITFNGMPIADRIAREIAQKSGILVFAEENSCFSDRKYLDHSGVILNRHSFARSDTWEKIRSTTLSASNEQKLSDYLASVYAGKSNTIKQASIESPNTILNKLNIPEGKQVALLLGQVPFDSVILYDSPVYKELFHFINDVIDIFAKMIDWYLVIRLHPLEEELYGNPTLNKLQEKYLPQNVRIVSGKQINTYALMDCSSFGITINSQSGLEMLSKHRPVIVAGNAFYGHKGFTKDIGNREELINAIWSMSKFPFLTEEEKKNINIYLYNYIYHYLLPYDRTSHSFGREATSLIINEISKEKIKTDGQERLVIKQDDILDRVEQIYLLGLKSKQSGALEDALKLFKEAEGLAISHGTAEDRYVLLIQIIPLLFALERHDECEIALDVLNSIKPNIELAGVYFELAKIYSSHKKYQVANRLVKKERAIVYPRFYNPHFERGLIMENLDMWNEAWKEFNEVIRESGITIDLLYHRERVARKTAKHISSKSAIDNKEIPKIPVSPYIAGMWKVLLSGHLSDLLKKCYVLCWFLLKRYL